MNDLRTIHGATSEVNLPGLESKRIELVRWDGDVLRLNDVSYKQLADVIRVEQIDGLYDDAPIRQERGARPDTYGSRPGVPYLDEKIISLTGYVKAGNFPMLRKLQRDVKQSLSFKTVRYADDEFWKLRFIASDYFENLIKNPSNEYSSGNRSGWGADAGSLSSPTGVSGTYGTYAIRLTASGSPACDIYNNAGGAPRITVSEGRVYTFQIDLLAQTGGRSWSLQIKWYDINNNVIGTDTTAITNTAGTKRMTSTAPASATGATVLVVSGSGATNDTITLDGAMLVEGEYSGSYFDGSTTGGFWTGTAHASSSFTGHLFEMLKVQPAGIQMIEKQDDGNYKRPFLITLKASDPRIYTPETATTWLYAASPKTLTIGGDIPSPVKIRINGAITNPIVTITQTAGSSPAAYAEEIAIKLTTVIAAGQYVDFDPWENTLTHSAGSSLLMTTGNRYNDLPPGTYTVAVSGTSTDGSTSVTVTQRDAIS